jgi:hypothetical protein
VAFYWWLIPSGFRRLRLSVYFSTGFTICAFVASLLTDTLIARPISNNWSVHFVTHLRESFQLTDDQRSIDNQLLSIWNSYNALLINWALNWSSDLLRKFRIHVTSECGLTWQCSSFRFSSSTASSFVKDRRSLSVGYFLSASSHSQSVSLASLCILRATTTLTTHLAVSEHSMPPQHPISAVSSLKQDLTCFRFMVYSRDVHSKHSRVPPSAQGLDHTTQRYKHIRPQ